MYVINHIDWFWSHRLPLALGAKEGGWDVMVVAPGATSDQGLTPRQFHAADLPASERGFEPLIMLKTLSTIRKLVREAKPDVIHAITLKYASMVGLATRSFPHVKVVHTIAGLGYLFSGEGVTPWLMRNLLRPFLRLALNQPRCSVIFQNPDDERTMIESGIVQRGKTFLIRGSGVDIDQFRPSHHPPDEPPIVLMPTRLVHDKGIAIFIEAARLLKSRRVNARFQIAGGLTTYNPLAITKEQMESMIADGSAEWLGKVSDMPGLLARTTVVAYPSYYKEGVPKVLLEAAAMGKAIVTTDHPGCREVVAHGENGLLVPVKNAAALADAIQDLLEHPKQRARMEAASRERAVRSFDVRSVVADTLHVYARDD